MADVLRAEAKEFEAKIAKAEAKLQEALATKVVEIKVADEKAYAEGQADPSKGSGSEDDEEEAELDDTEEEEDAAKGAKSPTLNDRVLDLTHDKEEHLASKGASPKQNTSEAEVQAAEKSLDQTLLEIDAEIAAEKEVTLPTEDDTPPTTEVKRSETSAHNSNS
ncbi:serine/threonine-protein phosphatase 4 regulatory subunit 2-A-like [Camellia sinensis]|uniref:serine/threonine-protein phosphatase 4 regulatory subunit 2-A-like n=1 Tax=Camellia sinensis TaxID=4442 RepID=UPI001036DEA8|nr:serine/threonine-protein phosphatase 4 regulatory subunit 2-A-like [Camellia sinensis]